MGSCHQKPHDKLTASQWQRKPTDLTLGEVKAYTGWMNNHVEDMSGARLTGSERIKPVYFNSNDYHGQKFLTEDAELAGYGLQNVRTDVSSLVQKGVASLVESDASYMLVAAENAILRILVQYPATRPCIRNIADARQAAGAKERIPWSDPAKEWLFGNLVELPDGEAPEFGNETSVLQFLETLPEAPAEWFGATQSNEQQSLPGGPPGALLACFDCGVPFHNNPSDKTELDDDRVQLLAQESFSNLLRAASAHRVDALRTKLDGLALPSETMVSGNSSDASGNSTALRQTDVLTPAMTDELGNLTVAIRDAVRQQQSQIEASQRLSHRILSEAQGGIREGQMSESFRQKLLSEVDEFLMTHFDQLPVREDENEVPYEDVLERIARDWGDWADEDYVWQPGDGAKKPPRYREPPPVQREGEEDLDEALARIKRDWHLWLD